MTTQPAERLPVKLTKTKKPKKTQAARRMYGRKKPFIRECVTLFSARDEIDCVPFMVIDISDPDALVEQVAYAIGSDGLLSMEDAMKVVPSLPPAWLNQARAVLTSLGILPAKKGRK